MLARTLSAGFKLPPVVLGTMGLSWAYQPPAADAVMGVATALFDAAQEHGVNALVTASIYSTPGLPHNETVIGECAVKRHGRDKWKLITKIGVDFKKNPPFVQTPAALEAELTTCLSRLGTNYVDLLVLNRPDPRVPIDAAWQQMAEFVKSGRAKHIGLSEASVAEIRAAHKIHPVAALEQEYSLFARSAELLLPTARELGCGLLSYSPLGRGLLAGPPPAAGYSKSDWRRSSPRHSGANLAANAASATALKAIAERKGTTPAALALAWVLAQGPDVVAAFGTLSPQRLAENVASASLQLTPEEVKEIGAAVTEAKGERYPGRHGQFEAKK